MSNEQLKIGLVTGTHGVRGEINVLPLTDNVRRFSKLKDVLIHDESGKLIQSSRVQSVKYANNKVIVKLDVVSDADSALKLRGKYLVIDRADAVKLPENTYFICDLIGCRVYDINGELYGVISDVLQTGASDIYVVPRDGQKDLLIPAVKSIVKNVDIVAREVKVTLPDGILDL